jgi:short-subunit dehydrogenase
VAERTIVAITGASSGIGAVFARKLAAEHDLLLVARRQERLEALGAELREIYGTNIEVLSADLAEETALARVAERMRNERRLALLINNAGFGTKGLFWESDLAIQERMHKLHVMATVRLTHAALEGMVASVSAFVRSPGSVSYGATKSWMTAFTEGLYVELKNARSDVTVQALCPGFTYSEFHDTMAVSRSRLAGPQFWMSAEDVVDASLDGLRRRKLFVIPGWRYRLLTMLLTKLPTAARLKMESAAGRVKLARQKQVKLHG